VDLRSTLTGLAALALVACAAPASQTTVTAANVSASPAPVDAPVAKESAAPSEARPAAPPGQLACRAETRDEGTMELYLEWNGATAKGVLRRTAPSGNVTEQNVTAERHQNVIIADDVHATDLVVHAATVADIGGKKRIRLGEWSSAWTECR